jgi:hypothetical protein
LSQRERPKIFEIFNGFFLDRIGIQKFDKIVKFPEKSSINERSPSQLTIQKTVFSERANDNMSNQKKVHEIFLGFSFGLGIRFYDSLSQSYKKKKFFSFLSRKLLKKSLHLF